MASGAGGLVSGSKGCCWDTGVGGLGALDTMTVVEVEAPTTSLSTTFLPCSPLLPWPRSLGGPCSW